VGARGKPCSVCVGDVSALQQIDSLIAAGEMPTAIARLTGIPKDRIVRHRKHTLAPDESSADPDAGNLLQASDERLDRWVRRSEEMFGAAIAQSDLRSAIQSVQSGLRAEVEYRRRLEASKEQVTADALGEHKTMTIADFDAVIRKVREAEAEALANGQIRCPCCNGYKTVFPSKIAERMPNIHAACKFMKSPESTMIAVLPTRTTNEVT
jgi:hypothetical protein